MHVYRSDYLNEGRRNFHKLLLVITSLVKEGLLFAPQQIILQFQGVCMVINNVLETQNLDKKHF